MKAVLRKLTSEEEKVVWQQALFVFDRSAVLNFYEYSDTTREDIYNNIFKLLESGCG